MAIPPGIIYLSKLLPGLLAPPLGTCLVQWLCETYFNIHTPRWAFAPLCLLSLPLIFTARVQYRLYADRRGAKAHGAVLPPTVRSSIGGIDLMIAGARNANAYPAEPLAQIASELGNIFRVRVLFKDRFFTCEPEHLKIILATEFNSFEKGEVTRVIFGPFLGLGIFSADGELWKFHRAMTRPFFKRDRISDFELFDRHSCDAVLAIKTRLREGHPFDFQDMISRFAMDTSGEFLFGHNAHTLDAGLPYPAYVSVPAVSTANANASNTFSDALNLAQRVSMQRGKFGGAWPLTEFWHNQLNAPVAIVRGFLDPILDNVLDSQRTAVAEKVVPGTLVDREVQEGETLAEHLLNYTQDRTVLRDEILNISVAGRDTTACLLTFVTYMLAEHPAQLAKLRAEILDTVGPTRAPTPEDFKEMKYLRAVLNETLRLYPPVPINMRSTTSPVLFPSTTGGKPFYLPAGSFTGFSVMMMHRRKDLWGPDATEWDPERFIDERLHKHLTPNPFIFLPFNAGPRICIGQQFAYHEASFFLVRLLQSFSEIALVPSAQPIPYVPDASDPVGWKKNERVLVQTHLTMFVEGGLWVSMVEAQDAEV
ncbi:cytochrome P450 [Mycena vitilis]|nr:cytochrome P450 [Mycena vitilis]